MCVVLDGFEKHALLLLGPGGHHISSHDRKEARSPALCHDGVSNPNKNFPCIVCAVNLVKAPTLKSASTYLWDTSFVGIDLPSRIRPEVSEDTVTLVVHEFEDGNEDRENPVVLSWPVSSLGLEEEDLSDDNQTVDEPGMSLAYQ